MIKNYLRVALRNLWRHKGFSFLNIMGLTIGMSACFLIFLYVKFELSYDDFHSKGDRIYRIVTDIVNPSETLHFSVAAPAMPVAAKRDFPEIEKTVRFDPGSILVRRGDVKIQEDNMAFADSTFFEIFDFPLLKGNPVTALRDPYSVVLSETAAKKYFGTADPMGQHLLLTDQSNPATVTGIMKDMPENSELKEDMLVAGYSGPGDSSRDKNWGGFGDFSYFLLKPNSNAHALEKKFPEDFHYQSLQQIIRPLSMRIEPEGCDQISVKVGMTDLKKTIAGIEKAWRAIIPLQPFSYFFVDEMFDRQYRAEDRFGKLFLYFAVLAIFISCLGLLGLASYSTVQRTKEIGVRKVLGASVGGIVGLLSKDFLWLVGIAFVVATPVSFFLMKGWLEGFAYRINIFSAWWIFAAGGLAAVAIAMLTISFQAVRAAVANPVVSLRSE